MNRVDAAIAAARARVAGGMAQMRAHRGLGKSSVGTGTGSGCGSGSGSVSSLDRTHTPRTESYDHLHDTLRFTVTDPEGVLRLVGSPRSARAGRVASIGATG